MDNNKKFNEYLSLQVDKFLTKSIKQEVQFTAYGFFVIDKSTIFKVNISAFYFRVF